VNIDVLRKGRKVSYRLTVEKLADDSTPDKAVKAPPAPKPQSKVGQLGLALGPLDAAARGRYKIGPQVQGVVVTNVDPGTAAGDKNMRPGDVIVQVQGAAVKTPDDVSKAVDAAAKSGKPVALFLVSRGGDVVYVGLRLN
jgi:serine protease Do